MERTLIKSEVDLQAEGKQTGYLRVPHSTHRSAYGWLGLPIVSIKNGNGPTILMMAGVHGDEYEGQIALSKLSRELEAEDLHGQLIILPSTNLPAVEAGLRTSPIDDGNLNRCFPGDPMGSPTQMIAHFIEEHIIPLCSHMVDLHSGGNSLFYPPTLLRGEGASEADELELQKLQDAFDLPYAWIFSGGGRNSTGRTAMAGANRKGVVSVMAELGGNGGVDREILKLTERGLRRILQAVGMLPGFQPDKANGTRELTVRGSIYAYDKGVFEPFVDVLESVSTGTVVGAVHFPERPWQPAIEVISPYGGIVLCKRSMGLVDIGDAVFQIADDKC